MPQLEKPVGYNIQITKVTDIAGGHETLTMNTQAPPDSTAADLYERIKTMRKAQQLEIDHNVQLERNRQDQERQKVDALAKGTGTPVPSATLPVDLTNGHARES